MCPTIFFYQVLIVVVLWVLFKSYTKMMREAQSNIDTFQALLDAPEPGVKFFGLVRSVEGQYRGTKVTLSYDLSSKNVPMDAHPFVVLRNLAQPQKVFILAYPRPTPNTVLRGDRLTYDHRGSFFRGGFAMVILYSADEFKAMLDELVDAARNVEQGEGGMEKGS